MAAFAAAVKIDAFAYMPVQDFGNAFSTFIAQNYGAKEKKRIQQGLKAAVRISAIFCVVVSAFVYIFAKPLMMIFVDAKETAIIMEGVRYLRIEGAFYIGIGWLFLLYGLYRALGRPGMSVVLTVFSLGTRVWLASGGQFQSDGRWQILWDCCIIKSKSKIWWKKSLRCDRVIKSKEYYYADIQRVFTYFS